MLIEQVFFCLFKKIKIKYFFLKKRWHPTDPTYAQLVSDIRGTLHILYNDTITFLSFRPATSTQLRLLNHLEKCLENLVCMIEDPHHSPIMVVGAISQSLITFDIDHIQKTLGKMRSIRFSHLQTYLSRIEDVCEIFRYIIQQQ